MKSYCQGLSHVRPKRSNRKIVLLNREIQSVFASRNIRIQRAFVFCLLSNNLSAQPRVFVASSLFYLNNSFVSTHKYEVNFLLCLEY